MRLKSAIWVAAYLRRRHIDGTFAVVRRRGAEEAGAVFVKIDRLDGTAELYGPAPLAPAFAANPFPRPKSKLIWHGKSDSIPTCGSSRSRTAPAATCWTDLSHE